MTEIGAIECLGEDLHRSYVVVAIHDQPGQPVTLAEDHAVSVGIAHHLPAIFDGSADTLRNKLRDDVTFWNGVARDQPQRDHRRAAIQGSTQYAATFLSHIKHCSGMSLGWVQQIRAVDPNMTGAQ